MLESEQWGDKFVTKSRLIHGDKYDYSKVDYVNIKTKVIIICPEHGEFNQLPSNHTSGKGCRQCGVNTRKTGLIEFINKANSVHNGKYDYSQSKYINTLTKLVVRCPEHGYFNISPNAHLSKKRGCSRCNGIYKLTNDEFINKAYEVHGDKFTYNSNYIDSQTKISIICPEHGEFKQKPTNHLKGQDCRKCFNEKRVKSLQQFIDEANSIHGFKYDYKNVGYKTTRTKIGIICPEHGEFKQKPTNHLKGNGCPKCSESKGERFIRNYLDSNKITFTPQYKFKDCRNKYPLSFDFYLPEYKLCIEYNGIQHYHFNNFLHKTKSGFIQQQKNDNIKIGYCMENSIKLLTVRYDDDIINKLDSFFRSDILM